MNARLITRCGCERTIKVPFPPPPLFWLPLRPPKFNEGNIRPWRGIDAAVTYDPRLDGLASRKFRLSSASTEYCNEGGDAEVWYDEVTDHDPPGFDATKRTYEANSPELRVAKSRLASARAEIASKDATIRRFMEQRLELDALLESRYSVGMNAIALGDQVAAILARER